jgi:outer membrane receptor protein involved in Fe transport
MRNEQSASTVTQALVSCAAALCITCTAHAEETVELRIPPQSLDTALLEFAEQSGAQVVMASTSVADIKTKGVAGKLAPRVALAQLIEGTGLEIHSVGEHGFSLTARADESKAAPPKRIAPAAASKSEDLKKKGQTSNLVTPEEGRRIETIIVTAQKREERLMEVPQSVTALPVDELSRTGISQFRDYADSVPGLAYNTAGAGYTQVVLRGVTTGYETSAPVAIYVDEVPYGGTGVLSNTTRQALDAALFDLDRIEVLRGPQGTLYGASAVGGLVKYVSKRPSSDTFEGQVQVGLASTEQGGLSHSVAGAANLPISEGKAGVRVSGFYNHDGGYIDNLSLGKDDVNQADIYGGRADLLLTPTEKFSVRLAAYAQNISRDGESTADFTFTRSPMDSDMTQRRPAAEPYDQRFRLASATLSYDFDWAELTSISSYQEAYNQYVMDLSEYYQSVWASLGRSYSSTGQRGGTDTDKFVQEIRLARASGERFEWVVGGFYTNEDSVGHSDYLLRDAAGQPAANDVFIGSTPFKYEEYAGFGTLTWHLTDKLDVSGGVRYSKDHQSSSQTATGLFAGVARPEDKGSSNATTYLANARYLFSDQSMLYARYATGYRPGGPNSPYLDVTTLQLVAVGPYDSDTLKSYEVGFRHETDDRRFAMDMAVYYIDWKDIIIRVFDAATFASYYDNAAGMHVRGGELALTARPFSSLTLAAAMAYTDAYMTEDNAQLGAAKGERTPTVPRFQGSLTADYSFSDVRWEPTLGASFRYTGDRTASYDQSPGFPQFDMGSYNAVDLRAGLSFTTYDVQLYVRNLLDERGQVSAYTWQGNPRVAMLQPRTIGLTVTTQF